MLCSYPFRKDNDEFGCGRCQPCRLNRRAIWTTRLVLENNLHSASCFATLTYSDENLPRNNSLAPWQMKPFLRDLRSAYGKLRYYLIGEYGASHNTSRPHYHALIYGQNLTRHQLESVWQKGSCDSGSVTHESAQYVAGYINHTSTPTDLAGRSPEFSRMSRNPGIGYGCVEKLVSFHQTKAGVEYLIKNRDVVGTVRYGKRIKPLGRYIVRKTREALGVPHSDPLRPRHVQSLPLEARYLRENLREVAAIRSQKKSIRQKL